MIYQLRLHLQEKRRTDERGDDDDRDAVGLAVLVEVLEAWVELDVVGKHLGCFSEWSRYGVEHELEVVPICEKERSRRM